VNYLKRLLFLHHEIQQPPRPDCPKFELRLTPMGDMPICNGWVENKVGYCNNCPGLEPFDYNFNRFMFLRQIEQMFKD